MLSFAKNTDHATYQDVENHLLDKLHEAEPGSTEYSDLLDQFKQLREIKAIRPEKSRIAPWIPAIGNVGGIGLIVVAEAFGNILSSKAVSLFGGKLLK